MITIQPSNTQQVNYICWANTEIAETSMLRL